MGIAARNDGEALLEQVRAHGPECVAVVEPAAAEKLRAALRGTRTEVLAGPDSAARLAADPRVRVVLHGITGGAGLPASLAAVEAGKRLALASKESLVMAGALITARARETGAEILPVDSEHSAVHQALRSGRPAEVARVILTASGGPFRMTPAADLASVTPEQALKHPTWKMGPKITVDSATLMNKALEVVEARWLFDLPAEKIAVVVHPQSVVHSLVEFVDGSLVAQLGVPDMKIPIQYALTWPERLPGIAPRCNLSRVGSLTFEEPDRARFPALGLGHRAAAAGGTMGAVLNGANEAAVALFLAGKIRFPEIAARVAAVMDRHRVVETPTLPQVLEADQWARAEAESNR